MARNSLNDMVKVKVRRRDEAPEELDREIDNKFESYYRAIRRGERQSAPERPAPREERYEREPRAPRMPRTPRAPSGKGNTRNPLWFVALIAVVCLFFALSFLFSRASVTITPRSKQVTLNENLSAVKDSSSDELPFDVVAISGDETKTLAGAEQKYQETNAKGTVIIYNAYGPSSQRLDINTRLVGSNGKIYKTVAQVTVPGMKGSTPGQVQIGIYGSDTGPDYNSGPLDFTIFGFKGTPKAAKFYARSVGSITGGAKGMVTAVSDADKQAATAELTGTLQSKLAEKLAGQIPQGFVLFQNATSFTVDNVDVEEDASGSSAVLDLKGTLTGFLFEADKLTQKIATDTVSDYDGSPVHIANMSGLAFTLVSKDTSSWKDASNISFTLSGKATVVWDVDTQKLLVDMLGKKKKDFNQILGQYPNIVSANVVLRPVWRTSFPDKSDDIKLAVTAPQ